MGYAHYWHTSRDFTEQEWSSLMQVPVAVGMYIIGSDVSLMNMPRETMALNKAMQHQPAPNGAEELVEVLVADFMATPHKKDASRHEAKTGSDPKATLLAMIKDPLAVLDAKGTPEERAGFRTWLLGLAEVTAEAGKEGGFLGIGAVRVSDKEKAALEELKEALGLA